MWKGKFDASLKELFLQYQERFNCCPDLYAEIAYELMTYDEFSGYIRECLEKNVEIPDVVK